MRGENRIVSQQELNEKEATINNLESQLADKRVSFDTSLL